MSEVMNGGNFVGFEYMDITAERSMMPMYIDCYENFGWHTDENVTAKSGQVKTTVTLKRNRKIMNKAELTRLQRNFEACMEDIEALEGKKTNPATILSLIIGIVGTAFMAGSVFAVTHEPPIIWLCILLAIPAFIGWVLAPMLFKAKLRRSAQAVRPLIEEKYDEIYAVCEKGSKLL